jgi:hypothetical protein
LRSQASWLLLCMLSGSSLLAVERGNNDLIIILLLGCSVFAPALIGGGLIVGATALKVYPIFAVPSLLKSRGTVFVGVLAFMAIIALPFTELGRVRAATPTSDIMSYGVPTLTTFIESRKGLHLNPLIAAACGLLASLLPLLSSKVRSILAVSAVDDRASQAFLAGAAVYLGTFLLAGNFDYRLIFLSLCVPYLLGLRNVILRRIVLISVLLACNQPLLLVSLNWSTGYALNMLAKTFLFVVMLGLFVLHILHQFRTTVIPAPAPIPRP